MVLQTPPPPSITPRQMNLLRVAAYMAWSDGGLAEEEADVMLNRFCRIFARNDDHQESLRSELHEYLMQNIPLDELVPKIKEQEAKELALRLGYEVISASARTPDEDTINEDEAVAYRQLVELLGLAPDAISRIEGEVNAKNSGADDVFDRMEADLRAFFQKE
ncbi:MAG: TerB family tellurite resistance protein [Cyanobacteria bacterium P01_E01_bin.6]